METWLVFRINSEKEAKSLVKRWDKLKTTVHLGYAKVITNNYKNE